MGRTSARLRSAFLAGLLGLVLAFVLPVGCRPATDAATLERQSTGRLAYNAAAVALTAADMISAVWIDSHPDRVGDAEKLVRALKAARAALAVARAELEAGRAGSELWAALGAALLELDAVRELAKGTGLNVTPEVDDSIAVVRSLVRANGGG